ncbi:hypothetical protein HXX76_001477 [Chlamydomonas incerta]|uniref:Uncharacterized protein n=1 Tax=Chlamydomonas incerta TaxID=51695 RepID=A0A835WCD4_CHLIN|nr:hypothetical protein HXX76_001477 [Chlamydomonas incerta]|eukprot:KAG2444733.1 hypothetical protein HXX76_001477 [Chlamydomonas incerta]
MPSPYHICAPLLSIGQQAQPRALFIDFLAGPPTSLADGAASAQRYATGAEVIHRIALLSRALSTCGLDGLQRPLAPVGAVVVVVAQTGAATMEAMLACLDAGCILCPVNWRWSASELAEALQRLSPALVLHDSACAPLAQQAVAQADCGRQRPKHQQLHQLGSSGAGHDTTANTALPLCLIDHWCHATGGAGPVDGSCSTGTCAAAGSRRPLTTSLLLSLVASLPPSSSRPHAGPAPDRTVEAQPPPHTAPPPPPPPLQLQLLAPACGTALLVFTSGTTAAPKGVQMSHAAFHAQSLVKLALVGYCPADTYLHTAPLFHIGGLSSAFGALMAGCVQVFMPRFDAEAALAAILHHHVSVFIAVPTMLQDLAAAAAAAAAVAAAPGTATEAAPGAAAVAAVLGPLGCVRRILVGAGGTAPKLQDAVSRTFPAAHLLSAYGMTEACSSMTFRHLRGPAHSAAAAAGWQPPQQLQLWVPPVVIGESGRPAGGPAPPGAGAVCVGWPAPGVQVRVVRAEATHQHHQHQGQGQDCQQYVKGIGGSCGDRASEHEAPRARQGQPQQQRGATGAQDGDREGNVCAPHELGEVQTRGPHTLLRYWRDDDATAEALTADGWLRTGDLGYLAADGGLWLLGRAKDMIKSGGENVFAPQVEAVLCAHPAVAAAAVVGLPHERLGEQVSALVVLRDGWAFLGPSVATSSSGSATSTAAAQARAQGSSRSAPAVSGREAQPAVQQTSLQDLQDFCRRQGLAGFRLPRLAVAQWQPLPLNGSGKVAKPAIQAVLQQATGVGMSRL